MKYVLVITNVNHTVQASWLKSRKEVFAYLAMWCNVYTREKLLKFEVYRLNNVTPSVKVRFDRRYDNTATNTPE